ncbi:cadherin-like domain-containing protein [Acidimicrobiia bacterium EGI L10123]|uniref:Ig-like domain-containing protein n=1 Tax=Salinilacustrithrix flava TaxID=2957203 RepID=UPI003D7C18EF|nr:cadherin-like domain-containing protein [Acidimicrobiia bacterium EGI L10123]
MLRLHAIEVNQAIQNWENDVSLYSGKDTVARVFLERLDDTSPTQASGVLRGEVNGTPLPGSPLSPENPGLIVPDDVDDPGTRPRADLDGSLNFVLPGSWTKTAGRVDLSFELTGPAGQGVRCDERDSAPDCTTVVGFVDPTRPLIEFTSWPVRRSEIYDLSRSATAGSFRIVVDGDATDSLPFDATAAQIDDAIHDLLSRLFGIRQGRITVSGDTSANTIRLLRGLDESDLGLDTSGLTGTATLAKRQDGGVWEAPSTDDVFEIIRRHSDALPTDVIDFRINDGNTFSKPPTLSKANIRLSERRIVNRVLHPDRFPPAVILSGLLLDRGPQGIGRGLATTGTKVASTYLWEAEEPADGGGARNATVHEAAHVYGKAHAAIEPGAGVCGATAPDSAQLHPFFETLSTENTASAETRWDFLFPTIGPLGDDDTEIWGFVPRQYLAGRDDLAVPNPRRDFELMSYCGQNPEQSRWPSTFTYFAVWAGILDQNDASIGGGGSSADMVVVSGAEDPETGELVLEDAFPLRGADPSLESGAVDVTLLDAAGGVLGTRSVPLDEADGDDYFGPPIPMFVAPVPVTGDVADLAEIVVTVDGVERTRVVASPTAPTVDLVSPTADTAATSTIAISWDAHDADGDELTAMIQYSLDDGVTWEHLATTEPGARSYTAPTRYLEGSPTARIRVVVSDGVRAATATSPTFVVDAGAPVTSIATPDDGATIGTDVPIHLRGDAWDPADSLLDGASLTWRSDLDGVLGTGRALDLGPGGLSVGCHRISFDAVDADGRAGRDTVQIDVGGTGSCTVVTENGTVVLERTTDPAGGSPASFTSDLPGLGTFDLADGGLLTEGDVPVGTYTVTQTSAGDGHQGSSLVCDDPDGGSVADSGTGTATVDLDAGETVRCEWTDVPATAASAADDSATTDEDTPVTVDVLANDGVAGPAEVSVAVISPPTMGTATVGADDTISYVPDADVNGTDSFTYELTDAAGATSQATVTVTVVPVADSPVIESVTPGYQDVDASDDIVPVTLVATDVDGDALSLVPAGLPTGITAGSPTCTTVAGAARCEWQLSGTAAGPASVQQATLTVDDGALDDSASATFVIDAEDATISPAEDNPVAVEVTEGEDISGPFRLGAVVHEAVPDGAAGTARPGDLGLAEVTATLVPVGTGGSIGPVDCAVVSDTGAGYDGVLTVGCDFDAVPAETYEVHYDVAGGYFTGRTEDLLVVAAPTEGSAGGGGHFAWPDADGHRTNVGLTLSYNKKATKVQGSVLVIRHLPDGTRYRLKSNALGSLTSWEDTEAGTRWATASGKATYAEPGWDEPLGNHTFTIAVEDAGQPGAGVDRIWIRVRNGDGEIVDAFTMPGSVGEAVFLEGGNLTISDNDGGGGRGRAR